MTHFPSVAVAIPVFNGEKYLSFAIESVLKQTFADFTFHIYDDGSTDSTHEILDAVHDPRLRIHRLPKNEGLCKIRQRILDEVDAEWIAFLDQDDVARPDRLEKQLRTALSSPSIVVVGSAIECIDEKGTRIGVRRYPEQSAQIRQRLPIENCIANPAALFHRAAAIKAGGFDRDCDGVEDYGLWLRMALLGDIVNHPEPLTQYRIHSEQYKAKRTRRQLIDSLRIRTKAIRLGYPLTFFFALTWVAQAALLLLPASIAFHLFMKKTVR